MVIMYNSIVLAILVAFASAAPIEEDPANSTVSDASKSTTIQFFLNESCGVVIGSGGQAQTGPSFTMSSTAGQGQCHSLAGSNSYSYTVDGDFTDCTNPAPHEGIAWAVYHSNKCSNGYFDEVCGGTGKHCYTCDGDVCGSVTSLAYAQAH